MDLSLVLHLIQAVIFVIKANLFRLRLEYLTIPHKLMWQMMSAGMFLDTGEGEREEQGECKSG